jgi:hypothetical protein
MKEGQDYHGSKGGMGPKRKFNIPFCRSHNKGSLKQPNPNGIFCDFIEETPQMK